MSDSAITSSADSLLVRARSLETLQDTYDAWRELHLEHAQALLHSASEHARLAEQGSFLVGAVRAAGGSAGSPGGIEPALTPSGFLAGAEAQLDAARERLEARSREETTRFDLAFAELRELLTARVARHLERVRPRVTLLLRSLGKERAILHVVRPTGDAPVLLLSLLTGAVPTRYDFLGDDSTEDLALAAPSLYPEEGVARAEVRPTARELRARVLAGGALLPVKGLLPVFAPERSTADARFFRLLTRGPVLEAEVEEGTGFRNVLGRAEAEQLAGAFVRLKLAGRIELEVKAE